MHIDQAKGDSCRFVIMDGQNGTMNLVVNEAMKKF